MAVITDWNGNVVIPNDPSKEWSQRGGIFNSAINIRTYFPIPSAYRNLIGQAGIHVVTAEEENRPDILAKNLYNSEDYWWLIYWMNGVLDPFSGPKAGNTIIIANLTDVINILG